jgi:Caspase domain
MTLVAGKEQVQKVARTHVLIIGVGRYRHLQQGAAPTPGLPALGQLTSPPASARALAKWFTDGKLNNKARLGSVELLLSDSAGQDFAGAPIDEATRGNIQKAFDQWKKRCDGHPDNVAIFYFCGHGLQKDVMVLLPEDFGDSENNRWIQAIDFDRTYRGMAQCQAGTQLYIVDACRQLSQTSIKDTTFGGMPLIASILEAQKPRTAPRLFATAEGLPAFGDNGQVSRLTRALIECLDEGRAAKDAGGRWVIDTLHLGEAVQQLIDHENERLPENDRQTVDPAGGDYIKGTQHLHTLPPGYVPPVFVKMCCEPDENMPNATFYVVPEQGHRQQAEEPGRWITSVRAGPYKFGCVLNGANGRRDVPTERIFVQPPVWPVTIDTA